MWKWYKNHLDHRPLLTAICVMVAPLIWFVLVGKIGFLLGFNNTVMIALLMSSGVFSLIFTPSAIIAMIKWNRSRD